MMFLRLSCPPMPHYVISGQCIFRPGDKHSRRIIKNVFDLIYVQQGCLYIAQDGHNYEIHEGQYLIICPEKVHCGYKVCSEKTLFEWIHFSTAGNYRITNEQELEVTDRKGNPNVYYNKQEFAVQLPLSGEVSAINQQGAMSYFRELHMVIQDNYKHTKRYLTPENDECGQQIVFLSLLKILSNPYSKGRLSPATRLHRYIEQNFNSEISVARVAKELSYSTSHIIRLFNKEYGVSPKQYMISLRIEDAEEMLLNTSLPISEISGKEGFGTSSQFIFQFRKITGKTPLQYRKENRKSTKE